MIVRRLAVTPMLFASWALLVLLVSHAALPAPLSTNVCGPIASDTTWTLAGSPYVVTCDVTVNAGVTLTVEPGVVVKVQGAWTDLIVDGRLLAQGTEANPIAFTSYKDDEHGGDTNGDGNSTLPAPGDWPGIKLTAASFGNVLDHTWIGYGGYGLYGNVRLYTSDVILQNSTFARSFFHGLYVSGVDPGYPLLLTNNTFLNNAQWAVYDDTTGARTDITLTGNTSSGTPNNGYGLKGLVVGTVTFSSPGSFPFVIYDASGALTVEAGSTLTFGPGSVVKTLDSRLLTVNGRLVAQGTAADPVVFTSFRDDAYGGDTDGNGGATSPVPGDWDGISVAGEAAFADAHLLYAGTSMSAALRVQTGGQVDFADGVIRDAQNQGVSVAGTGRLLVSGSAIEHNQVCAVEVNGDEAWVHITGSSLVGNGVVGNPAGGVRNNGNSTVVLGGEPGAGNTIQFNAGYGAYQAGTGTTMLATYNWWGDASGPYHPTLNPAGLGEEVSDRVAFAPWLSESNALPAGTVVDLLAPLSFSPGETVNLGIRFGNTLTETLQGAVAVVQLPELSAYVASTGGGLYRPEEHDVIWKLGDVEPGDGLDALVRVETAWGLSLPTSIGAKALAAATNLPNAAVDLEAVLSYTPVTTLAQHSLTPAEIAAELAVDPDLAALFQQAQDMGFTFYDTALAETYSNGSDLLTLALLDPSRMEEVVFVRRAADRRTILRMTSAYATEYNDAGGWRYDLETGEWDFWGESATEARAWEPATGLLGVTPIECSTPKTYPVCFRNCLYRHAGSLMSELATRFVFAQRIPQTQNAGSACYVCRTAGLRCGDCAYAMIEWRGESEFELIEQCVGWCEEDPNSMDCRRDYGRCSRNGEDWYVMREVCDPLTCNYTGAVYVLACDPGAECEHGCCAGVTEEGTAASICTPAEGSLSSVSIQVAEPLCTCMTGLCSTEELKVRVARDPNAKLGPAEAAAGEWLSYTVQFENVGSGTAYGVYVEDQLSPLLDDNTLEIEDGGLYFPTSRTIYWPVGELDPGAGGSLGFRVQVPTDAVSGTVIMNGATVYFPSVPETTPTGDVVTLVQDLVAHSQRVETVEGVPLAITLTGYGPAGPLTYYIVSGPVGGTLSGTPPSVVYSPTTNFEGPDGFTFRVSDGLKDSAPAQVSIVVNTGTETVPPEVFATSPATGEADVHASDTPVYAGTYAPSIIVYFTEPIDPATVTAASLLVADAAGQYLTGYVAYDAGVYAARFVSQERLYAGKTYTATVTTGVHDTSGNALAASYVWSFTTEAVPGGGRVYLPVVLRQR